MAYNPSFLNIDPLTGKPKMLPTNMGTGMDLHSLIGAPRGTSVSGIPGIPGAAPAPIDTYGTMIPGGAPGSPTMNVGPMGQLPPYLLNQAAGNLSSELRGELPQDVQNLLAQQSAEYGVGSGTQGSQFQGYRGLRNLGLTSLDMSKHATDLLANQFTSPSQQAQIDMANRQFGEGQRQFGITQAQHDKEFQAQQALEKERFASQQNQIQHQLQLQELESLGLKYGGGGASGGGYGFPGYAKPYSEDFIPVPYGGF